MTYACRPEEMNDTLDFSGQAWEPGTLRCFFWDKRQYWGVSPPYDEFYSRALASWAELGGEFFDGKRWRPLKEWGAWEGPHWA